MFSLYSRLMVLLSAVTLLASCSGDDKDKSSAGASLQIKSAAASRFTKAAADTLQLDTVKILMRNIQFKSTFDDSLDFQTGMLVVRLNLTGTPNVIAVSDLPNGTYDRVKFRLHKPEDFETPPDPEFKIGTSGNERFSVIVKGRFNGSTFLFRSNEGVDQELSLSPPLVVSDSLASVNVTILVDPTSWFVSSGGGLLDPSNLGNENEIENNIETSFEAFEDNDEDGIDD